MGFYGDIEMHTCMKWSRDAQKGDPKMIQKGSKIDFRRFPNLPESQKMSFLEVFQKWPKKCSKTRWMPKSQIWPDQEVTEMLKMAILAIFEKRVKKSPVG